MKKEETSRLLATMAPSPALRQAPRGGASRLGTARRRLGSATAIAAATLVAGCGGGGDGGSSAPTSNTLPTGVVQLSKTAYTATTPSDGTTPDKQDLLTGGLGKTGLGAAAAPAPANPLAPTAMELRRNALFSNYRGIADFTANGGYGTLYGPNVDASGTVTTSEGMIPGTEYMGYLDDGSERKKVAMAIQIPNSFDQKRPCIILGPSSGSRGVYGAIGSAAEWGLKKGCAVALTDAGKGVGLYDPTDDTVNKIDGTRDTRTNAGKLAHYAAAITEAARTAFNAAFPNRLSLKQAHSQLNPEKDWGTDTLAAARYALWALNDKYGSEGNPVPFSASNTLIIGGSVSNGGAAVLRAAEADTDGLIDGVVAAEPVAQMPTSAGYSIQFGTTAVPGYGKHLADYVTYSNIYQPCAALAAPAALSELTVFNFIGIGGMTARAQNRCASLARLGLVSGADLAAQSLDALNKLRNYGWTTDNDQMHNAHYALGNAPILAAMYPMAYGRFGLTDNVCNTSFASTSAAGDVVAVNPVTKARSFELANGTANGTPANVVYNTSAGGAKGWQFAVSPSSGALDFGLDFALCQRALVTGTDPVSGAALTAATTPTKAQSDAVKTGMAEVTVTGAPRFKPTIIVAGRSDALVPVNNNARAYVAYNNVKEGFFSKVRYVEVTNAQHFDAFNNFSGFDTRYVPLHVYYNRAMDAMWAHLTAGAALPSSQVVRTTPRGGTPGAAPAITAANVPAISASPAASNQITFSGTTLVVPN